MLMAGDPWQDSGSLLPYPCDPGLWGEPGLPLLPAQLAAGHLTVPQLVWLPLF